MGVVIDVISTVETFALENGLTQIDTLVLQIGELSSMIPSYIEACYPAAVDGTMLEQTKLRVEVLPGNGLCAQCGKVFNVRAGGGKCSHCGCERWELLSGKEFMIKEIVAY